MPVLHKSLPYILVFALGLTKSVFAGGVDRERADKLYAGFTNVVRDLQYKQVDGFEDADQLSMDLILPDNKLYKNGAPVVLYIHGGGWAGGARYIIPKGAFRAYNDKGIAIACVSYRASTGDPEKGTSALECLIDCKDAARFLAQNADKYGLDPTRFATRGHSAGAHLTLCMALVPNDEPLLQGEPTLAKENPRFVCAVAEAPQTTWFHPEQADSAGTISMNTGSLERIFAGKSSEKPTLEEMASNSGREKFILSLQTKAPIAQMAKVLSPEFWLDKLSPPVFVKHGTVDKLISVRGARYFKQLGDECGAKVQYIEVENGNHGFRSDDPEKPVSSKTVSPVLKGQPELEMEFLTHNLLKDILKK